MRGKFETGRIVVTIGVDELMRKDAGFGKFVKVSLGRFLHGDWGDLCQEDRDSNEKSLMSGDRLFASYVKHGTDVDEPPVKYKIWIITEADRSATTILFPEEY